MEFVFLSDAITVFERSIGHGAVDDGTNEVANTTGGLAGKSPELFQHNERTGEKK